MSDTAFANSAGSANLGRPRALNMILCGGLVVGVLDGLYAIVMGALRGGNPIRLFQFISSGLLGRSSFSGGSATVVLGVLLHFLIAFILTSVYFGLSLRLPLLIRRPVISGMIYGVGAYLVMNFVVIPLSAVTRGGRLSFTQMLIGAIGHAVIVGLPIALIASSSARRNSPAVSSSN